MKSADMNLIRAELLRYRQQAEREARIVGQQSAVANALKETIRMAEVASEIAVYRARLAQERFDTLCRLAERKRDDDRPNTPADASKIVSTG